MVKARPCWRSLLRHCARMACCLALARAGRSMAARMAMMAMTTSNSMRVKPAARRPVFSIRFGFLQRIIAIIGGQARGRPAPGFGGRVENI